MNSTAHSQNSSFGDSRLKHGETHPFLRRAKGAFRLFALVAALASAASAGAMTDREEMELVASGKINVKKAASSGFETAPEPSDIKFVVDRKSNGEVASSESNRSYEDFSFTIPIDRYFGDVDKLIENGGLPTWTQLTMLVYDVDEPDEVDELWFDGKKVGNGQNLSGANQYWKKQTFSILTKTLHFPEAPGVAGGRPTPANNTFTIKVSTKAGEHGRWCVSIAWASLDIPAAPPVVISHGIWDDAKGMTDMAKAVNELGLPTKTFDYHKMGFNSIEDGTRQLAEAIKDARKEFGVEKVTILCHSMGGLKARHFASEYDKKGESVDRILQIATPNGGSMFADALCGGGVLTKSDIEIHKRLGQMLPNYDTSWAIPQLTTVYMKDYNKSHKLNGSVTYVSLAGDCSGGFWDRLWGLVSSAFKEDSSTISEFERFLEFGEGDGIVSVSSAHTIVPPLAGSSPIKNSKATHTGLAISEPKGIVSEVVSKFRRYLLEKRTSKNGRTKKTSNPNRKKQNASENETASPIVSLYGTQSSATENTEIQFLVRKSTIVHLCFLVEENDCSYFSLISPSGRIYTETADTILIQNTSLFYKCLLIEPESGCWKVRFRSSGTEVRSWTLMVQEADSGIELNPELAAETVRVGNSFSVTMRPKVDGVAQTGVSCSVVVQTPDKTTATYALSHTGGGVYSASVPATVEGRYSMVAQATISGTVYTSSLYGTAYSSSARIGVDAGSGPVDEDGDGMYDWLVAKVGITGRDSSKAYRVLAELVDANGDHIEWASGTAEAGASYAELYFNGAHIFDYGRTSKYVVTDVRLFEMGDNWEAQTDAKSNWLELDGSTWAKYDHELLSIIGTGEDSVVRPGGATTGNLSVGLDVAFDASVAGYYSFSASLKAPDGTLVASAYGSASLSTSLSEGVGVQRVVMEFPGADIVAAGKDGPWTVTDILFWNSYNELSPEGEYETSVQFLSSLQSGYDLALALTGSLAEDWPSAVYLSDSPSTKGSEAFARRSFLEGETIYPHVSFANVGTVDLPSTPFIIRHSVEDEFGNVMATWDYEEDNAIKANDYRYWYKYAWPGLQDLPLGRYTYTVTLDTGNSVPEADETNNSLSVSFKIVTAIPPDNDDFADATPIYGAVASAKGSNVNATRENGEPLPEAQNHVSGSAWWSWTAPEDGSYCISTEESDFDTVLSVYAGDSLVSLVEISSSDDIGSNKKASRLWVTNAVAGTTYRISVAGYSAKSGSILLSIQPDIWYASSVESRIQEAADCYHLPFATDTDTPWDGYGNDGAFGGDAVRSGRIGHSDYSILSTAVSGSGILAFKWKVSSEKNYDLLSFYIDNKFVPGSLSGTGGGWRYEAFKLTGGGDHGAVWIYDKDSTRSQGDDCGWIDNVVWVENSPLTPVYRFYSSSYKGHFFTINRSERDNLIQSNPNWNYEGAAFFTYESKAQGTVAAYRFYSKAYRGHFYTIDEAEMNSIRSTNPNWRYEGVAYYVRSTPGAGTTPVYRFWSKRYKHHFFTTSASERDNLIRTNPNWKYEGVAFYAWATPEEAAGAGVGVSGSARYSAGSLTDGDSLAGAAISGAYATEAGIVTGNSSFGGDDERGANAGKGHDTSGSATDSDSLARGICKLAVLPDETEIGLEDSVLVGDLMVETRAKQPEEGEGADDGEDEGDGEVAEFRFTLPEGAFTAQLQDDAETLLDKREVEGTFDFALPANARWHGLRVSNADGEEVFAIWLRVE